MASKKLQRMTTVQWLAMRSVRDAADELIASGREVNELTSQIEGLRAGREEYVTRLSSGNAMGLAELRLFISKLDGVIDKLQQQLKRKEQQNTRHREQWQGQKRRSQALDNIGDRYRREEEQNREAKLQREIDDYPGRKTTVEGG